MAPSLLLPQFKWPQIMALGFISSVIIWIIADPQLLLAQGVPLLFLLTLPLITLVLVSTLLWHRRRLPPQTTLAAASLITAFTVYSLVRINTTVGDAQTQTIILALTHLPLVCWLLFFWAETKSNPSINNRYAFLRLSLNYLATLSIGLGIGFIFTALSLFLFEALTIEVTYQIQRIFIAGLTGFIPPVSLALAYHPHTLPQDQPLDSGTNLMITSFFRLFLLFSLVFLLIYAALIPAHLSAPFQERQVLIVYNLLSFAVLAIILGSLPVKPESAASLRWLHRGILALLVLAFLILTYALVALLYRLYHFGLTPNRLTILGWDLINLLVIGQSALKLVRKPQTWQNQLHTQAASILWPYLAWASVVLIGASFIPLP